MSNCAAPAVAGESQTAVAAQSTTREVPFAASKGSKLGKWSPAGIIGGCVNVVGGWNKKPAIAHGVQYQMGKTMHTFVELDKNALWFLKGVGGGHVRKGDLKAVQILQEIRVRFNAACEGEAAVAEDGIAAVAGDADADNSNDDDDPMNALDDVAITPTKPKVKTTVKWGKKVPKRAVVQELTMLKKPVCAGGDKNSTRGIWIYRMPASDRTNHGKLYLRSDCLDWLLAYAADELHFQGVVAESEPQCVQKGNCSAVADLLLEWDFGCRAWDSEFVGGVLEGTTLRICADDSRGVRWVKLRDMGLCSGDRSRASRLVLKKLAKDFITLWAQAIVANQGTPFETLWGLRDTASTNKRSFAAVADNGVDSEANDDEAAVADSPDDGNDVSD